MRAKRLGQGQRVTSWSIVVAVVISAGLVSGPSATGTQVSNRDASPSAASALPDSTQGAPVYTEQFARSDSFWQRFVWFLPGPTLDFDFNSIDELTAASQLVVRGRITDVYVGEWWSFNDVEPAVPLLYATVAIDQVVKGQPASKVPGAVEVLLAPLGSDEDYSSAALPDEQALWFLQYEPEQREAERKTPVTTEIAQYAYVRPNSHQTVFRDIDGITRAMFTDRQRQVYGIDAFPTNVEGLPFETLTNDVETAVKSLDSK